MHVTPTVNMKWYKVCVLTLLLTAGSQASIWGERGSLSRVDVRRHDPDPATFNPADLLDAKTQKPEMWAKAISELQELKKKPSCSRLAASMLMNDCQLLEGMDSSNTRGFASGFEGRLEDYINGYAASLAICDIEAAQGPIPEACEPFREATLLRFTGSHSSEGPHVSKVQIDQCMNGLIRVPTSWTSWTSSRDRATLFCRASRIDIEKDQMIVLHQKIADILQVMIVESREELQKRRQESAEHELATKSYFRDIIAHLGTVKNEVSSVVSEITVLAINVKATLQGTSRHAQDVRQILANVQKTLLATNAEHAAVQQIAVNTTADLVLHSRDAQSEVNAIRSLLMEVHSNANSMNTFLIGLQQRQDALDAQSNEAVIFMRNLTEALQGATSLSDDHLVTMSKLKDMTCQLQERIETASKSALTWSRSLSDFTELLGISWPILVLSPTVTLLLGSYGLQPSLVRNLVLIFAGVPIAKVLSIASKIHLGSRSYYSSSFTPLQRRNMSRSSIITTPATLRSLQQSQSLQDAESSISIDI